MKPKTFLLVFLSAAGLFFSSFSGRFGEIKNCFLHFDSQDLKRTSPQQLPETSEKTRRLPTEDGEVDISRIDGYRVLYLNKKKVPFVNLKVELSEPGSYGQDTINLLKNLQHLNLSSKNMETKDLIKLNYNGYRIYGLSRSSIEEGSTLGSFVMFPGENITVYFDFNNSKPSFRSFKNLEDYKSQRNQFIGAYTSYLNNCFNK